MNKHLRNYFREQRHLKGMRLGPLAELAGFKDRSKGAQRILQFEREGVVSGDLLQKLVEILEIDHEAMIKASEQDRAEWEAWADEPVPMCMIERLIAAVYCHHPLPPEITTPEEAEAYARNFAKQKHRRVCLALNRRVSVWIGQDGETEGRTTTKPGLPNIPYATFGGGSKFLFGC